MCISVKANFTLNFLVFKIFLNFTVFEILLMKMEDTTQLQIVFYCRFPVAESLFKKTLDGVSLIFASFFNLIFIESSHCLRCEIFKIGEVEIT